MLEEATESFQLQLVSEDEEGDESLTVERLTSDISPVIRLVDSTSSPRSSGARATSTSRRRTIAVNVKYRIDGVLQPAMRPIAKQFHSSIISRIKVMAELDIAEKRVPQDGRFKLRMPGKTIDFRVSIMPSVHGEDAVIRILDKESISEQFTELRLDILGLPRGELKRSASTSASRTAWCSSPGRPAAARRRRSTRRCRRSSRSRTRSSRSRIRSSTSSRGITQIPINEKKGLTFARGLRSILRHDPDKIMVGEIRDAETAQIADQLGAHRPPRVHDRARQQRRSTCSAAS